MMVPIIPHLSRNQAYPIYINQKTKYIHVSWYQLYPFIKVPRICYIHITNTKYINLSGYQVYSWIRVPSISMYQGAKYIHVSGYQVYSCIRVPSISMYQGTKYIHVSVYLVYPCIRISSISNIHVSGYQVYQISMYQGSLMTVECMYLVWLSRYSLLDKLLSQIMQTYSPCISETWDTFCSWLYMYICTVLENMI